MFKVDDSKLKLVRTNNKLIFNDANQKMRDYGCEVNLEALQI